MARGTAGNSDRRIGKKAATSGFVSAIRAFAALFLWLAGLIAFSGTAQAQANIHNGGVPLNVDQNSSSTASGTLPNRGSDSVGSLPYNGARFNFTYALTGAGNWVDGVEYRINSGTQVIRLQPQNVNLNGGNSALYNLVFTRGVQGLTFRVGGLDNLDTLQLQFRYQNAPINITTAYVSATGANAPNALIVSQLSPTQIQVASTTGGSIDDMTVNWVQFTVPAGVLVDEVRVISGKGGGATGNNTIGFHAFNWLPRPIVANADSVSGINGVTGQANVLNVLTNDTLDNPNTAGLDPAALTNVTVTQISTTNAGVTLNPATGQISVAAGTASGTYTVAYRICETNSAPANCATANATVTVAPVANLVTTKVRASSTATPSVGDTVSFTITVRNNGPATATNVSLTDNLPAGLTATASNGTVSAGSYAAGTGVWTIPSLANGASATLTIQGTVNAGQGGNTITNTLPGPAISNAIDPTTTGDDLSESVTVALPVFDLSITKTNGTTEVFSGSTTTYTVTVTNNGPDPVTGAVVKDTPGAGITCDAAAPVTITGSGVPSGSFTFAALTGAGITLGTLTSGQSTTFSYSCQVN